VVAIAAHNASSFLWRTTEAQECATIADESMRELEGRVGKPLCSYIGIHRTDLTLNSRRSRKPQTIPLVTVDARKACIPCTLVDSETSSPEIRYINYPVHRSLALVFTFPPDRPRPYDLTRSLTQWV